MGTAGRYAESSALNDADAALLDEALAGLDERDDPRVVKVLAALANNLHYRTDEQPTDGLSRSALEMARRIGDPATLVVALQSRQTALGSPPDAQ